MRHRCEVCRTRRDGVAVNMTDTSGGTPISICEECADRIRRAAAPGDFECVFCETDEFPAKSTGLVFNDGCRVDVCDDCRAAVLSGGPRAVRGDGA